VIDRATEPLEAVVVAVGDLNIVDLRPTTDSTHRQGVQLGVRRDSDAGELDAAIL
jgi:hypothetical protein